MLYSMQDKCVDFGRVRPSHITVRPSRYKYFREKSELHQLRFFHPWSLLVVTTQSL